MLSVQADGQLLQVNASRSMPQGQALISFQVMPHGSRNSDQCALDFTCHRLCESNPMKVFVTAAIHSSICLPQAVRWTCPLGLVSQSCCPTAVPPLGWSVTSDPISFVEFTNKTFTRRAAFWYWLLARCLCGLSWYYCSLCDLSWRV